jgi:hypothetical protein
MSQPSMTAMPVANYKYQSLPNAVKSTSKTVKFQTTNGNTFNPVGSNNISRIDVRSNGMLAGNESYLKFTFKNNCGQSVSFDPFSSSLIDRVRILSGATILSDISGYAELASHLVQTAGSDDLQRTLAICSGYDPEFDVVYSSGSSGQNAIATTAEATYTVPLLSGLMSGSKYIPLEFLAGGLTIEIYWQTSFFKALKQGSATALTTSLTYTISNIEYVAKIVQIDDDMAMNNLKQLQLTQGLKIKSYDWTLHQNIVPSGTGTAVLTIPARNLSLKSLVMLLTHTAPATAVSGIQSYRDNVSEYYVRIGSTQYPVATINVADNNLTEAFSEACKVYGSGGLYNVLNTTAMLQGNFNNKATYTTIGGFSMCINLENYSESDLFSGLDTATLSQPINFYIKFGSSNSSIQFNALCFANYDVVYTILPNGMVQVDN